VHKDWFKNASDIEEILHFVRLNGGNVTAAVSKLRSLAHGRFQALAVSTVQGWLVPHQKKVQLLPQYQEVLNRGKSFVAGPGRKPMLEKQDMGTAKGALKTLLEDQRKSGATINSSIICSLTIGVLLVFGAVATTAGVVFDNGTTFSVSRSAGSGAVSLPVRRWAGATGRPPQQRRICQRTGRSRETR
jgi:hypothetical protein